MTDEFRVELGMQLIGCRATNYLTIHWNEDSSTSLRELDGTQLRAIRDALNDYLVEEISE